MFRTYFLLFSALVGWAPVQGAAVREAGRRRRQYPKQEVVKKKTEKDKQESTAKKEEEKPVEGKPSGVIKGLEKIPVGYVALFLDLILLLLLFLGAYKGFKNGFIGQLILGVAVLFFLISGKKLFQGVKDLIKNSWPLLDSTLTSFIACFILLLSFVILVWFVDKVFRRALNMTFLGYLDSVLGAILGFVQASLLMAVIIWLLGVYDISFPKEYTEKMRVYQAIASLIPKCVFWLKTYLGGYLAYIPGLKEKID